MPGGVGRPSRRSGMGRKALRRAGRVWEALLESWEGLEGISGELGGVRRHFQRAGRGSKQRERMKALTGGRRGQEALPKGLEGHSGGVGGVGRPYRRAGRGLYALLEGLEGLGGSPRGSGGVRRPLRRARRGREAFPVSREGSGGPPVGEGGVGRLSRRAGKGWEALQ